jgi:DNA repair exonuclease SbcCD ATPase subunit
MHPLRKNSNESASSHGTDDATSSGKDKDDKLVMQKKMKTLKDAYLKEKASHDGLKKQMEDMKKRLDSNELLNGEKENKIIKLQTDMNSLEQRLRQETAKCEALKAQTRNQPTPANNNFGGFFDTLIGGGPKKPPTSTAPATTEEYGKLKSEYQKLLDENAFLNKQQEAHLKELGKASDDKEAAKKDLKVQLEDTKKKLEEISRVVENQRIELTNFARDKDRLINENADLKKSKSRLEHDFEILQQKYDSVSIERDQLYKSDQEKINLLNDLNDTCVKMESEIKELADQKVQVETDMQQIKEELNKTTDELVRLETQLQTFNLKKISKFSEIDVQLIMRKNVNNDFVIEIETNSERNTILPENIADFGPNKDIPGQFTLCYKHKSHLLETDIFKTNDVKKLLHTLKNFVTVAKQAGKSKKTGETKEKKNLLSDVVSFFGS